jgi:hypothetical protein
MKLNNLQKKKPLVINTKIIIETNNEKYSLKKSSFTIDNIRSITRLYSLDNKKFGKYKAYTKIVMINNKLFGKKIVYSPETFETIIKNSCKKLKKSSTKNYNNNKSTLIFISTKFILPKNKIHCGSGETDGKYCLNGSTWNTQIIRSITRQDKKIGKYIAYTKIVKNRKTSAHGFKKTFYSPDTLEHLIKSSSIDKSENNNYYNMW